MDQRPIVVFLHLKSLSAKAKDVHMEHVEVLGSDAIASSAMTKHIQNHVIVQNKPEVEDRAEDQSFSITDNVILEALERMRFASIRQIAKMTIISHTTGFRRLTKSFHFVLRRLPWVTHRLSDLQNRLGSSCQKSY
jgi:hypothetical protein